MPDTARFVAEICCSTCGTQVLNSARCCWGGVPDPLYRLDDPIRWVRSESGEILEPFVMFRTGDSGWDYHWNCGDPAARKALVFDEDLYTGNHQLNCHICDTKIAAARITVEGGRFVNASAITATELSQDLGASMGKAFAIVFAGDGDGVPREDWFDHPVPYRFKRGVRP